MSKEKVVLLGDSMIDTYDFMGQGFPELKRELDKLAPEADLTLVNHGVGSTDVSLGVRRVTEGYDYTERGRKLQSVLDEKPNLVVIESFAYNHWGNNPEDLERFIDSHKEIIRLLQSQSDSKIVLLATVAPNREKYASGVLALNWTEEKRQEEYGLVMKYFDEFIKFAEQSGLPFVNVFELTLDENGTGNPAFVSNVDYIHVSYEGREIVSKKLAPIILEELNKNP